MIDIAGCESHFMQFNPDGSVLRGKVNPKDVGYYQINEYWNGADAKKLGYNIYSEAGNIGYALYLYHTQGTKPWNASKSCWGALSPPSQSAKLAYL